VSQKYRYIRYRWLEDVDIDTLTSKLEAEGFTVKRSNAPVPTMQEISIHRNTRREILVKADTLGAFISTFRATLFQREAAPFTMRDLKLRERLLAVYQRDRSTPFPFLFSHETPFTVADEEERS
jgi:hypothetical protein